MFPSPLVTLALPLYKSNRFLDIICANLDSLAFSNLEILISDRHCADNAIDVLEARYGTDSRFRFMCATDEIGWVDHYNALLRKATGEYFLWMPHDDTYPENYLSVLVKTMQETPDAIVAYSDMQGLNNDGSSYWLRAHNRVSRTASWTWRNALTLFLDGDLSLAMRGLFRRKLLAENNLFLVSTRDANAADMVWLYAVACVGRFVWTPDTWCQKRYYATSTHARWTPRTWQHSLAEIPALRANIVENQTTFACRLRGWLLLLLWVGLRLGRNLLDAIQMAGPESHIRRVLLKFVRPARG